MTVELLSNIEYEKVCGELRENIESVTHIPENATLASAFLVLNDNEQAYENIKKAIDNGCKTIIASSYYNIDTHSVCLLKVDDIRKTYALIAKNIYSGVDDMKVVGVIGTNGKSTTSYLIWSILQKSGIKAGFIGTGKYCIGDREFVNNMTTPDPLELHEMFSQMRADNVKVVVMEVSAHAIALKKIYGINYDVAIFTNFSQDHLDYFGALDNYKRVKKSFFLSTKIGVSVINTDDKCGQEIANELALPKVTYGITKNADAHVKDIIKTNTSTSFTLEMLGCESIVKTKLIGEFNVYNIVASIIAAKLFGLDMSKITTALEEIEPMDGRFNTIVKAGRTIIIDYAHTPEGMKNLLKACKSLEKNKIILVFGAGGNRDRTKRAKMGEIAVKYADCVILTSDNPRFEDRMKIIFDIYTGVSVNNNNVDIIEDREMAIEEALRLANDGDLVVIAGKGAEEYIEENGVFIPSNDKEIVERKMKELW